MEFADVLRRRKAVRSYLPDPVPRETLERIVARGRKIPSAGHSQGLRLVVVTAEETRRAMAELALEPEYVPAGLEPRGDVLGLERQLGHRSPRLLGSDDDEAQPLAMARAGDLPAAGDDALERLARHGIG